MRRPGVSGGTPSRLPDVLGLRLRTGFLGSAAFYLALLAGPAFMLALDALWPELRGARPEPHWLLSLLLWQPLVEELLFRGVLQGQFAAHDGGSRSACGISLANLLASLLFMAAHLARHPPGWAVATLIPSLLFGWFREREGSILPGLVLHMFYNACFFLWP
jgi:uncharacterized protein